MTQHSAPVLALSDSARADFLGMLIQAYGTQAPDGSYSVTINKSQHDALPETYFLQAHYTDEENSPITLTMEARK